jgi:hypothetical protein
MGVSSSWTAPETSQSTLAWAANGIKLTSIRNVITTALFANRVIGVSLGIFMLNK